MAWGFGPLLLHPLLLVLVLVLWLVVLPLETVRTFAGVSRAFFVVDDRVEERLLEVERELPDGLAVRNAVPGERVVRSPSSEVADGRAVMP